jgi:signal peptidase I
MKNNSFHLIRQIGLLVLSFLFLLILFLVIPGFPVHLEIVLSDSMAPAMRTGDLLVVKALKGPVLPGMVVSFESGGQRITHRVIGVEGARLRTKGDNNATADPWEVATSDVKGIPVLKIPCLGLLLLFIRRPAGLVLLVFIPGTLILLDEIRKVVKALRFKDGAIS